MQAPLFLGFAPTAISVASLTLNAAATWLALSWAQKGTKTINAIDVYISANNGTVANITCSCDINGDAAGIPDNAALAGTSSSTINAGSWPAANNWASFAGFSCVVTDGSRYHLILKNLSGAPATDYPTFRYGAGGTGQYVVDSATTLWGTSKVHTLNSGTAWASGATHNIVGFMISYSDGTYEGFPCSNIASEGIHIVQSAKETGARLTTLAHCRLNVIGVSIIAGKAGSPTGNFRLKLYLGVNLQRTSNPIPAVNFTGNTIKSGYFSKVDGSPDNLILEPSSDIRVVASASGSDTGGNSYFPYYYTIQNSVAARSLMPFNGTLQKTYTTDATANPVVFSEDNTKITQVAFILDPVDPFALQASGGSKLLDGGLIQ